MYDKHNLERESAWPKGKGRASYHGRVFRGELDPEIFISIYHKVAAAYGKWEKRSVFYDLGCGVGNLVYAAAFTGDFYKCGGIDGIQALVDRGEKRMPRWNRFKEGFPREINRVKFLWENDNYLENPDVWRDATWILLHWTALNKEQLELAGDRLAQCREGCIVVTFTTPIMNSDFEILIKDSCEVSWGTAVFYVQEKLTPRKKLLVRCMAVMRRRMTMKTMKTTKTVKSPMLRPWSRWRMTLQSSCSDFSNGRLRCIVWKLCICYYVESIYYFPVFRL